MSIKLSYNEYFELIYKLNKYKLNEKDLYNKIEEQKKEIDQYKNEIKILTEQVNRYKNAAVSVDPNGNIAFSNETIKDEITKNVVKDIILDNNLQILFSSAEELNNKVVSTFEAIRKQDGISIEKSLEKETLAQIENIKKTYDEIFIKDLKANHHKLQEQIVKQSAEEISSLISLPNRLQYRGTGDPIFEQYSQYQYTIKGDNSGKIYKVKGISYEQNTENKKIISNVVVKLVNTVLSAEELVVAPEQLVKCSFRTKINDINCRIVKKTNE